ncbi:MAG: hypothetical protein EHM35_01005 [Planctomycetaceae bacterium]|nr:MAG: hypothetical protein EHM35_01005 [Planctomycetaceae bacterium]
MTEYVVINGVTHAVNTESEIKAAASALTAAGVNSADVWRSPRTLEDLLENGDPDAVKTGQVVLADSDVDSVENGTQPDKRGACARLVEGHIQAVLGGNVADITSWKGVHLRAWKRPRKAGERAVKLAIEAYAAYADDYYDSFESDMGTDGYFGEHARDMLSAINASLTMGFNSDLDSGAVHRLLADLARASGVDPDEM